MVSSSTFEKLRYQILKKIRIKKAPSHSNRWRVFYSVIFIGMIKLSELIKDILVKSKKTGKKYDVKKPDPSKHDFTWDYRGSKENPNPFSKKKANEGVCEREPGESDSDYLTRCGNQQYKPLGSITDRSNIPLPLKRDIIPTTKPA